VAKRRWLPLPGRDEDLYGKLASIQLAHTVKTGRGQAGAAF